jgi:hypothetical protein
MLNIRTSLYGVGERQLAREASGLSWNWLM